MGRQTIFWKDGVLLQFNGVIDRFAVDLMLQMLWYRIAAARV